MKSKRKLPRNGAAIAAHARHAGPMKDKRDKRGKEQIDLVKETTGKFVCTCGYVSSEVVVDCPGCGEIFCYQDK